MIRANLFERVLLGIAALGVFVLLFFFLAAALLLGSVVVAVLLLRLWWFKRSIKQAEQADTITTEYTVIERERAAEPRLPDPAQPDTEHESHAKDPPPGR